MQRGDLLEKTLTLGKIEVRRKSGQQGIRWLVGTTNSVNMNLSKLQETVKDRKAWGCRVGRDLVSEQQQLSSRGDNLLSM